MGAANTALGGEQGQQPAVSATLGPGRRRTLEALARALAPGTERLPRAVDEIPVVENIEGAVEVMGARERLAVGAAIDLIEWLPAPRRVSTMEARECSEWLERLNRSSSPVSRELLMVVKTLIVTNYTRDRRVAAAIGARSGCEVAGSPPPRVRLACEAPDAVPDSCDFVIVGSGAGGAAAAAVLAEAGAEVAVLELGGHHHSGNYREDPLEAGAAIYRNGAALFAEGLPPVPVPVANAVGGTTVINSGTCFRAPEKILREWSRDHGVEWATDLAAEYAESEEQLAVERIPEDGLGRNGQLVANGAERLGLRGEALRRNAGSCVRCGSCPTGCPIDAKRAMHVSYLPRAAAAGARIFAEVEARTIEFEGARATGVRYRTAANPACRLLRARHGVISAGGTFGTPELLLRSGVAHPQLGHNLRLHPSAWIGARFEQPVRGWDGVMQSYGVEHWAEQGLMMEATFTPLAFGAHWLPGVGSEHQERLENFDRLGSNGVQVRDRYSRGRVRLDRRGRTRISYRLDRREARALIFGIARAAEIWFAAGATEVYPQVSGSPILGPGDVRGFEGRPPATRDLRIESFHPMGSARLGGDPARGVVGTDGAVHGRRNLYVADASLFPSAPGVNPMLTIIACASRIARGLARSG